MLLFAVVLGWTGYDLALLAVSGEPRLVTTFLPAYVALLLAAAIVGILCRAVPRLPWMLLALTACAAAAPKFHALDLAWHLICLPRAVFLLLAAFLVARGLGRRSRPALWPAVGLGAMAAAVFATYLGSFSVLSACALVAGSVLMLTTVLRRPFARQVTTAATLVVCLGLVAAFARQNAQLRRDDRPHASTGVPATQRPNLLLIVLDTVSAKHLAPYGYARVTTPGLDDFVREYAIQYTQARSVSSWTLPSHASIFTGLYPSEHGADHPRLPLQDDRNSVIFAQRGSGRRPAEPLRDDVPTLAERLSAGGYQTGAIVANAAYLAHEFGVDRGFEHYDDRPGVHLPTFLFVQLLGVDVRLGRKKMRRAETITNLALRWIDSRDRQRPFFLFLNYMDGHGPYLPLGAHKDAFGDEHPSDPLNYDRSFNSLLYDRELRYLDVHLTRLLHSLNERKLMDDTVLIITADHGEAFGEHGFWGHNNCLYEPVIRVPLYVKAAGPPRPGVSDRVLTSPELYQLALDQVGLARRRVKHPFPIIAEWYQFADPTRANPGSAVPLDRDLVAWLDGGVKWLVSSKGAVEAYDLRDPDEKHPLDLSQEQIEESRARARAWWQAHPPIVREHPVSTELDPDVTERLRALGYVQ